MNPKPSVRPLSPVIDQSPKLPVTTRILKPRERKASLRTNPLKAVSSVKTQRKPVSTTPDIPKDVKNVRHPPSSSHAGTTRKLVMSESSSSDESGSEEDVKEKKKTPGAKPEKTEGGELVNYYAE